MSDTEERENSPISKEEEGEDVKKMESDNDEDANHDNSDDEEPSPTKLETSTACLNESSTKSPSPKKKKQPAKKVEVEEEEEENENESDGELQLGLLERPVVIESGKRQKKKVERLDISGNATPKEKKQIEFDGAGLKLGDCPRIELQIQKNKAEDLKLLHRYLFGLRGATNTVKRNLRNFNGFSFENEDKEYEKKAASLIKYTMAMLKQLCGILDLERQGSKEQVIERLMTFCMEPKDSGKKVPVKQKRKRAAAGEKKEKGVKRKRASKKEMEERRRNAKKAQEEDENDDDEEESVEDSAEEEEEKESEESDKEESKEESEEEEEEEAPKKKRRKIETPKKKSPKETKAKKPAAKKETKKPKVTPKKVAAPVISDSDSDDSDDSDDEPLQRKAKPSPPTNEDLKTLVKKILDKANLEEVTMKSVIKEVYGKYPAFDLSDRKDFIKKTVKQLIT